jgi:hypothetical protein
MAIEIVTGAAAAANVANTPANVLLYGGPGLRKTTDAVDAFTSNGRCHAFHIPCEDGALKTIAALGKPMPDHPKQTVKSWAALCEVIAWLAQNRQNYTAVIIDTLSTLATYMYRDVEAMNVNNKNKFAGPVAMRSMLFNLREWIRMLGLHSVFIAHPLPPVVQEGIFFPGGFEISPKTLIPQYFGLLDTVLRVDWLRMPGQPATRVYYTGGEVWPQQLGTFGMPTDAALWRVKNREGCNQMVVPADLGAFLRARQPPYPGI